ncbi:unnamed protein product [Rhizoctonia solani]|uniref:Uncharacterized protein n=1 Tax=Rhizoctonia solani TaxID=456999 RepID=A0A8H3GWE4_9AGAM|nr:unnamed protein product [Rhizoctonia solani]
MRPARASFLALRPQAHGLRFGSFRADVVQIIRNRPFIGSHLASGLAGGGVVLVGGYLWFHFSGIKPAIETAIITTCLQTRPLLGIKPAIETAISISNNLKHNKTQTQTQTQVHSHNLPANEALAFLRAVAKSYVVFIPGGSWAVDSVFNSIEELHQTHHEQIDAIIHDTYADVKKIIHELAERVDVAKIGDNNDTEDITNLISSTEFDNMANITPVTQQTLNLPPNSRKLPEVAQSVSKGIQELTRGASKNALEASEAKVEDAGQLADDPY